MSRGPEAAFWKVVRERWPGHSQRVEASDGEVDPGTPDTVLSVGGKGGWIELKVWPDNVSGVQLAWHVDAIERGAYAMVLSRLSATDVWLGPAEDYDLLVRRWNDDRGTVSRSYVVGRGRIGRPEGVSLQAALYVIECALIGNRRRG